MIRNYITIAFRSMMRNKAYSLINILGLSVGVACCLLLALYIQDEMSYDRHHHNANDLYQVTSIMGDPSENKVMPTSSAPIVWGIKDELPEIETVTRLVNPPGVSQNLIEYEGKQFYESDGYIADSTMFDIFKYEFQSGNPKKALVEANSIVIAESLAEKLFGKASALNKVISVNQGGPTADFKVTGVLSKKQENSHIKANFFVSMTSSGWAEYLRRPSITDQWAGQNFLLSYIKLKPGHSSAEFVPKMNKVFLKYGADDLKTLGMKKQLGLQPVKDIYLYATYGNKSPRVTYLYVIGSIAVFILLIACINFMNLSTAKATKRANEVGLRKTLGAYRSSLILQFLGEALFIVAVAIVVSLGLVQLLLPVFNQLTIKNIGYDSQNLGFFLMALIGITIITGLFAGSYPALYLSSFQPAKVLKGKVALNNSGGLLRKSLIVFQFVVAITLVCGMFVITKQLNFMQEKDLGFDANNKIIIPIRSDVSKEKNQSLFNETSKLSAVRDVSGCNYVPGYHILNDFGVFPEGSTKEKALMIKYAIVEANYTDIMSIPLIAGRKFSDNRASDTGTKMIVNRTAAKRLGLEPAELAGSQLFHEGSQGSETFEVIGVMEDYHQVSLKEEIYPIAYFLADSITRHKFMVVAISGERPDKTIAGLENIWKNINPQAPFEYSFLDENVKKQYDEDKRVSGIITSFTVIAMIICCLGLYGLSTYMAERRFKEIGVRKVMGATVAQIVQMMSGEFVMLVGIAFMISVPFAWYSIHAWLESFAYKTPVSAMIFISAGLSALGIALLTVSFESVKAASENPVKALRDQ
jgi:putative ABC transport system permease protein